MKPLFLIFIFLSIGNLTQAQDVVFENPENRVIHDFLDTSVYVNGKDISVRIGPDHKLNQNTIFFNKPFVLKNSRINYFRIKGSFLQHFIIDSSVFTSDGFYIDSTNFDTLFISNSRIKGDIVFESVYFKDFRFNKNDFSGKLIFRNCTIPNFESVFSNFKEYVVFINCKLGNLDFGGTRFQKELGLALNTIEGRVNFQFTSFGTKLDLQSIHASPATKFDFVTAIMPDTLNLKENGILPDTFDLTTVSDIKPRPCLLLLNGTNVSNIQVNYAHFKIIFPKKTSNDEKERVYKGILQNLEKNSFQASYEKLDVEYRRFKTKQGTFGFLWRVPEWWWNYGYNRERVLTITFWALVIFTILNYVLLNFLVSQVYPIGNIPAYFRPLSRKRLWFAFVYTTVIFFSLSLKIDKINFQKKLGSLYLMAIYVFGLVCLAYIANYIIQR